MKRKTTERGSKTKKRKIPSVKIDAIIQQPTITNTLNHHEIDCINYFLDVQTIDEKHIQVNVIQQEGVIHSRTDIHFNISLTDSTTAMDLHPNGKILAYVKKNGDIVSVDSKNCKSLFDYGQFKDKIDLIMQMDTELCLKWSKFGKYLWLLCHHFYHIFLFDGETKKCLGVFTIGTLDSEDEIIYGFPNPMDECSILINKDYRFHKIQYSPQDQSMMCLDEFDAHEIWEEPYCDIRTNFCSFEPQWGMLDIHRNDHSYRIQKDRRGKKVLLDEESMEEYWELEVHNVFYLDRNRILVCAIPWTGTFSSAILIDFSQKDENSCAKISSWRLKHEDLYKKFYATRILNYPKMEVQNTYSEMYKFDPIITSQLPNDCWQCIFEFLDYLDLLNVSNVCKIWNQIMNPLWKYFSLRKWKLHPKKANNNWKKYFILRSKVESFTTIAEGNNCEIVFYYPCKYENIIRQFLKFL